jgi:hypothetical protein
VCGNEVGKQLATGLQNLKATFDALPSADKWKTCDSMPGSNTWDVNEFYHAGGADDGNGKYVFNQNGCGTGACVGSVSVFGTCYWAAEVNYVLWGFGRRMCHDFYLSHTEGHGRHPNNSLSELVNNAYVDPGPEFLDIYNFPWYYNNRGYLTEESMLYWVRRWRQVKHGWWLGRDDEDPNSLPPRRDPGNGLPGREEWSTVGWRAFDGSLQDAVKTIGPRTPSRSCAPCNSSYSGTLRMYIGRSGRRNTRGGYSGFPTLDVTVDP